MNRKTKIILSAILVVAWMIVIFCFSAMPADESNSESMNIVNKFVEKFEAKSSIKIESFNGQEQIKKASTTNNGRIVTEKTNRESIQQVSKGTPRTVSKATLLKLNKLIRKFAHASVYFILYILVLNLIYQIKGEYKFTYCMISIVVCFLYACTDEFHQLFVEGRSGLFSDVIIDTLGATISYIIIELIHKVRTKIQKSNKCNRKLIKKDKK